MEPTESGRPAHTPTPPRLPFPTLVVLGSGVLLAIALWRREIEPLGAVTIFVLVGLVGLFIDRFLDSIDRGDRPQVESHWGGFGGGLGGWHLSESLSYLCAIILFTALLAAAHWNAVWARANTPPTSDPGAHPGPTVTVAIRPDPPELPQTPTLEGTSTPTAQPSATPTTTQSPTESPSPTVTATTPPARRPRPKSRRSATPTTTPCAPLTPVAAATPTPSADFLP